jgi:hypothetical protein
MLQDVIERFRYRFQLWHRERREDSMFSREPRDCQATPDDSWRSIAPKHRVILMGSTPRFIVRTLVIYLAILSIIVASCLLLGSFVAPLRYVCLIAAILLGAIWTLTNVLGTSLILKQRREYRSWRQHLTNR